MKKPTSPKQIAANRRNAPRSIRPRTTQGKAVSKQNAFKHGILSKDVLVDSLVFKESETEFTELHRRFHEDLQPEGVVEEMLVDQIVTAHWRMRRALNAESGEIALVLDRTTDKHGRNQGFQDTVNVINQSAGDDPLTVLEGFSIGNSYLVEWLRDLRATVTRDGALTVAAIQVLSTRLRGKSNRLVRDLEAFRQTLSSKPESREREMADTLAFLDRRIDLFRCSVVVCAAKEEKANAAHQSAALLPSAEVLEKILRYETNLDRRIHRALCALQRIQQMRRSDTNPQPSKSMRAEPRTSSATSPTRPTDLLPKKCN
jgi:hypothetical protein